MRDPPRRFRTFSDLRANFSKYINFVDIMRIHTNKKTPLGVFLFVLKKSVTQLCMK